MTNRESEVLSLIKNNPLISQKELAEILGIARSSVAVHITNLIKKGLILGKGYVVSLEPYVIVIGGSNIDIQGFPESALKLNDSNPGIVETSLGGVGRNISENIARLNVNTGLLSLVGNDVYGDQIITQASSIGIDTRGLRKVKDRSTSTYLSVMDECGDMKVAIAHMEIINHMDIEYITEYTEYIRNSNYCVLDTNLPKEVIEYILCNIDSKYILDCVSCTKALKVKNLIGKFHTIKPNKLEAELLSGIKISSNSDLEKVADYFIEMGVENVFISLGEDGVFYSSKTKRGKIDAPKVTVISATGAGDAFVAGIIYAYINNKPIEEAAIYGSACSVLALESSKTINQNLSEEMLINTLLKYKFKRTENNYVK